VLSKERLWEISTEKSGVELVSRIHSRVRRWLVSICLLIVPQSLVHLSSGESLGCV
jgi:hypothetical protein